MAAFDTLLMLFLVASMLAGLSIAGWRH